MARKRRRYGSLRLCGGALCYHAAMNIPSSLKTLVFVAALALIFWQQMRQPESAGPASPPAVASNDRIVAAARNRQSDVQVLGQGRVVRVLQDDNQGSRHQRLIVEIEPGLTVLIAHNIDLAPRAPVRKGDLLRFFGEYEWNERGGVIHWTHHDPQGRHPDGWLELNGRRYQ